LITSPSKSTRCATAFIATIAILIPFLAVHTSWADNVISATRSEISLNGAWQTVTVTGDGMPNAGWVDTPVPTTAWSDPTGGAHFMWFRKAVSIPSGWTGRRIFLDFSGARYNPHLYINGKLVASQLDGFSPFKTEITTWVQPGSTAEIELSCEDRNALFKPGFALTPGASEKGETLAPAGGYKNFIGLWDDVTLSSEPQDRIDEDNLVIVTSTRKGTLTLSGTADGSGLFVSGRVLDAKKDVLDLPRVQVPASGNWTVSVPFPNAHYWSPEDPHLYTLELALYHNTQLVDTLPQRFGFKEIWTQGPDFYLNGAKRHLFASAAWPIGEPESNAGIDAKVRAIRASNTIAFRLHNQTWPEEWLRAADEAGLMIVDETPLYTDSNGNYAYTDPTFWSNYRDEVAGMIRRDRNHPSLALWSLENETLFIGCLKYDPDLPKKLGDLGRFAKQLDPTHPITYEADQDPDGATDVMGLHYPHELPWVYDYPNAADWLGAYAITQAAGGLLGNRSTGFYWERKKPLYIGEYLWLPQGDYSDSTIYFGDDSYLNHDKFHALAQSRAFYDQTIGYRRSGVSGMAPWSAFGFGGKIDNPDLVANEHEFFSPIAAFPKSANLRRFGGSTAKVAFDDFDDDGQSHHLVLRLIQSASGKDIASQSLAMAPGDYRSVSLSFPLPKVSQITTWDLKSVLYADGKAVHSRRISLRIFPLIPLHAPEGTRLVIYDPSGKWQGSDKSLSSLANADISHTVLIVAPDAFGASSSSDIPTISGAPTSAADLLAFLRRGGRALVLDQHTLAPLGLDFDLVDHNSTMTFPLRQSHPILKGLIPDDLLYWAPDNYVTKREIARPASHGARAVTVSGGQDALAQSPIIESPVGQGWLVVMQALAAEKRSIEPTAQVMLQNAVDYLAAMPRYKALPITIVGDNGPFSQKLAHIGVDASSSNGSGALILNGGGAAVAAQESSIKTVLQAGGTVYWHAPDSDTFAKLRNAFGAEGLEIKVSEQGTSLGSRESPLLSGVSREDVTYAEISTSWDRPMTQDVHASSCQFIPMRDGKAVGVQIPVTISSEGGSLTLAASAPTAGIYRLTWSGRSNVGASPVLRVDVNDVQSSWLQMTPAGGSDYDTLVELAAGSNQIRVSPTNRSSAGQYSIAHAALEKAAYPSGTELLVLPGAVVTWKQGGGRVVLDGMEWDTNTQNALRGARYASALFSALGFAFTPPSPAAAAQSIPLSSFKLTGDSPYFDQSSTQITMRTNGVVESKVRFADAGRYQFRINGLSSICDGVYGQAKITVDGQEAGIAEVKSTTPQWFDVGGITVPAGVHTIGLAFINDASNATEDRNLFVQGVSVTKQ